MDATQPFVNLTHSPLTSEIKILLLEATKMRVLKRRLVMDPKNSIVDGLFAETGRLFATRFETLFKNVEFQEMPAGVRESIASECLI